MTPRFYTRLLNVVRLLLALIILFNPVAPALAEILRAEDLSDNEVMALLLGQTSSDLAQGFNLMTGGFTDSLERMADKTGDLPLIGDQLADGISPLMEALYALSAEPEERFTYIYQDLTGDVNPVQTFERGLFELFGPEGLDLLVDGPDAGEEVNQTDLVRTSGRDPNWVQWDMHLGQKTALVLPFELGAGLEGLAGFANFGFDVKSTGVTFDFFWDARMGFGIHAADGFYINSEAHDDDGAVIEELRAGIEVYAEPGPNGEPGIAADVALGIMNGRLADGTLSRTQITAGAPLASADVLTASDGMTGTLVDYTRNFTLTLTDSISTTVAYPIIYENYGGQTFNEFLTTLNLELTGVLTGTYGSPLPAVVALSDSLVGGSYDAAAIGGPVLYFMATTPEITAMTVDFDTTGDCTPFGNEVTADNDHCAWGFEPRQHEDGRARGLGFAMGQASAGSVLLAAADAPVNGALAQDVEFTLVLNDATGTTRVPVALRSLANDDIVSLDDLTARLNVYLNGAAGALYQAGILYPVQAAVVNATQLQLDCQGQCSGLRVDYDTLDHSKLTVVFAVDLVDTTRPSDYRTLSARRMADNQLAAYRADDARRLSSAEMREAEAYAALPDTFRAQLVASAAIRLHIESDMQALSGFVEQGLGLSENTLGLPEVTFDFKVAAATMVTYETGQGLSKDYSVTVQLDNVTLKLGSLLDYIVKPLANILGAVLMPVLKVVGAGGDIAMSVLNDPIPLLEDIGPGVGLGQPSLLDLADWQYPGSKEVIVKFLTAFVGLAKATESLMGFLESYDGRPISMGCWQYDKRSPLYFVPCELVSLIEGESGGRALASYSRAFPNDTASVNGVSPYGAAALAEGALPLEELLEMAKWQDAVGGFQVDILQPGEIVNLMLGNDFGIVSYNLPAAELKGGIGFGIDFDILAFESNMGGSVELAQFGVGYDSAGLRKIAQAVFAGAPPDFTDLMDGFYVATGRGSDEGPDLGLFYNGYGYGHLDAIFSTWFCKWGLDVWAELGMGGGFTLDVNDPNNDSRLRLDEIMALTGNFSNPLKAICLFDPGINIHGNFDFGGKVCLCGCVSLSASDLGLDSLCSFDITLDIGDIIGSVMSCEAQGGRSVLMAMTPDGGQVTRADNGLTPILAKPIYEGCERVLRVNSGPFAGQRMFGDTDDRDGVQVAISPFGTGVQVDMVGYTQVFTETFDRVLVIGDKGDDAITVSPAFSIPVTLLGLEGSDSLTGGSAADFLDGGEGADILYGGDGDDTLHGDDGTDVLYGDAGNDILYGGTFTDTLYGGDGVDELHGGRGNDTLHGDADNDILYGDENNDILYGDAGDDILNGGWGADTLYGDNADGATGMDRLYGNEGADVLYGGPLTDTLHGDGGDDTLYGGDGPDALFGDSGFDTLRGNAGCDVLYGDTGDDDLDGGAGDDKLYGEEGEDFLLDGDGSDVLYGGLDNDHVGVHTLGGETWLQGDAGVDTLVYSPAVPVSVTLTAEALFGNSVLFPNSAFASAGLTPTLYTLMDAISVTLGAGDDAFILAGPTLPLTLTTGDGNDSLTVDALSGKTTINTGADGSDIVLLHSIQATTTITTAGADFDVIVSSRANRLNFIQAPLMVDGSGGGETHLLVRETGASANRTVQLTPNTLTGLGASGVIGYQSLDVLALDLGAGDDTIAATGPSAALTTLEGGLGSNTLILVPQTAAVTRTISTSYIGQITVDNTTDPGAAAWVLSTASVAGDVITGSLAATTHNLTLLAAHVDQAVVNLGSGVDRITIQDAPFTTTVNSGGGNDVFMVTSALEDAVSLSLNGAAGSDTLVWTDGPSGRVTIHNATVEITNSVRSSAYRLPFTQMETLTISTGSSDDVIILRDVDAPLASVALNTNDGNDTVSVQKAGTEQTTTVSLGAGQDTFYLRDLGPASVTTVNGDGDDDVFRVNAAGLDSAVVISGSLGSDALTFDPQGYTTQPMTPTGTITVTVGPTQVLTYADVESVQILDAAPVVTIVPPASVSAGGVVTLTVSAVTAASGTVTYTWDLDGDGIFGDIPLKAGAAGASVAFTVTGSDLQALGVSATGNYVITAQATDDQSQVGEGSAVLTMTGTNQQVGESANPRMGEWANGRMDESWAVKVNPVAPQFTITGGPDVLDEGQIYTLDIAGPGDASVMSYTVSWGDGKIEAVVSSTTTLTHTYTDNGDMNIAVALKNETGLFLAESTLAVLVHNVAPTLWLSSTGSLNEGLPYTLTLNYRDVGNDALNHWRVDWDDETVETVWSGITSTVHTYADEGVYAIAVTATDEDGTFAVKETRVVTVHNVAPTLSITGEVTTAEGAWYTLDMLACNDPGADTMNSWTLNWGDQEAKVVRQRGPTSINLGNATTVIQGNDPRQATHQYLDGPGVYTVTILAASDEDGTYTSDSQLAITVRDTPPTITVGVPNAPIEGTPYTLTLEMIDPGVDVVDHWEIAWGDGERTSIPGTLDPAQSYTYAEAHTIAATRYITSHLYPDDGGYTGTVTVRQAGGISTTVSLSVVVRNAVPQIYLTGEPQPDSDAPFTLTLGLVTDPGDDTVTEYRVIWNDDSRFDDDSQPCEGDAEGCHAYETFTTTGPITHTFQDAKDIHIIRVNLVDEDVVDTETGEYRAAGSLPAINRGTVYSVPLSLGKVGSHTGVVTVPETLDMGLLGALDRGGVSDTLRQLFASNGITLSASVTVTEAMDKGRWQLDNDGEGTYYLDVDMKTPEYISFAPLDIRFAYELTVYEQLGLDYDTVFTTTGVIQAQATNADTDLLGDLDSGVVSTEMRQVFSDTLSTTLALTATIATTVSGEQWRLENNGVTYVILVEQLIHPTEYRSFDPADFTFGYQINIYTDKEYQVGWGDSITNTYTIADDYEIFTSPPSVTGTAASVTTRTLQLNARHVYRGMGVYTVTFSVVPEGGRTWAFHTYPVVVSYGKTYAVYLPVVTKNHVAAPDLVVKHLIAATDNITVVLENQGNVPVNDGFWVMGYIDPDPIPDAVNQVWYYGYSEYGVSWEVTAVRLLIPGGTLTLTLENAYPSPYTALPAALPVGTPVYVQVDAYHPDTDYGAVLELDEIWGWAYNNIAATVSISGTGGIRLAVGDGVRPSASPNLPRLPRF